MDHALELQLQNVLWWQWFWLYVIGFGLLLKIVGTIWLLLSKHKKGDK